jgi:hypothetical protein
MARKLVKNSSRNKIPSAPERPPVTIPEKVREMWNMNHCVIQNVNSATIAKAIWEGKALTMGTDGSVHDPTSIAIYSFVRILSISQVDIQPNVRGGGFLPPMAEYFGSILLTDRRSHCSSCRTMLDSIAS